MCKLGLGPLKEKYRGKNLTGKVSLEKVNEIICLVGPRSERRAAGTYSIRRSEGSGGWRILPSQKHS